MVQLPVMFDTTALEVPTQVHHVSKAKVKVVIGHSHVAFTVADVTACGQVVIQSF
ncbi:MULTISPECIES: hypothetical protein [Corallococcus]|uniref:hypothetical protein n=1 Tax=Corallococcus TaxID=83461 RepID=UPI0013158F01|nr:MULTISPECIES: hypothetical protein [Corallococcus]